jgi:hypothetical protein
LPAYDADLVRPTISTVSLEECDVLVEGQLRFQGKQNEAVFPP